MSPYRVTARSWTAASGRPLAINCQVHEKDGPPMVFMTPRTTPTLVATYTIVGSAGSTTTPSAGAVIRVPVQVPLGLSVRSPQGHQVPTPSKNHKVSIRAPGVPAEKSFSPVVVT